VAAPNAFDPTQIPGNRLARRPVHSGTFAALVGWRRFGLAWSGYFTGRRTDSDFLGLGLTHTPGYARFDLAGTCQVARAVSAHLRVQNLFDRSYQDALGYPGLGREVRAGMNYRFGGRD
jgi:vitamin B12 transporter